MPPSEVWEWASVSPWIGAGFDRLGRRLAVVAALAGARLRWRAGGPIGFGINMVLGLRHGRLCTFDPSRQSACYANAENPDGPGPKTGVWRAFRASDTGMTDTICSTGDTRNLPVVAPWYRWPLGPGMLGIFALLTCLVWLEARAWSRLAGLAEPLKRVVPTEFDPAFEIRGRIEGMNRALLQFQLSGEPAERDEFHRPSRELPRDLEGRPGSASATHPEPVSYTHLPLPTSDLE